MELFDIENNRLKLSPTNLYIPPFRSIWERDKTKGKEKANAELAYVTFLCNMSRQNPYNGYSDIIKESKIKKDLFGDKNWEPDDLVKEAINKYKEMQETTNSRLLKSAKNGAQKLADYFDKVDFNLMDNYGRPVYSAKEYSANLKEVGNIVKSLSQLEKQVEKEQIEASEARGGTEIGMYEIPPEEDE